MTTRFDMELEELSNEIIRMGSMCQEGIASAINAINNQEEKYITRTIEIERLLDNKEKDIESLCMKLLIQQHPVACDLRTISSSLKMITDMERIGDQARDIAEISRYVSLSNYENYAKFNVMAKEVIKMVRIAVESFIKGDVELAKSVIDNDDVVDGLFIEIRSEIISSIKTKPKCAESFLDLAMIVKYLERIGDHATNIAEWVEFSVTGVHKE